MSRKFSIIIGATLIAETFWMAGCATSAPKAGKDPIAEWQASRMPTNTIPLNTTLKSVQLAAQALEISIRPLQVETYGWVDDAHARIVGRKVYTAVQNDVKAGAKMDAVLAKLSPSDLKNYKEYAAYVQQLDYEKSMSVGQAVLAKLEPLAAAAGGLLAIAQKDPDFVSKGMLDKTMETSNVGKDIKMLKEKLADVKQAVEYWWQLNKEDNEAKKFMAQYPVK